MLRNDICSAAAEQKSEQCFWSAFEAKATGHRARGGLVTGAISGGEKIAEFHVTER